MSLLVTKGEHCLSDRKQEEEASTHRPYSHLLSTRLLLAGYWLDLASAHRTFSGRLFNHDHDLLLMYPAIGH